MLLGILQYILHPVYGHDCLSGDISKLCAAYNQDNASDYIQYYIWLLALIHVTRILTIVFRHKNLKNISAFEGYSSVGMSAGFFLLTIFLGFITPVVSFSLLSFLISLLFLMRYKNGVKGNSYNLDAIHSFALVIFASILMIFAGEVGVPLIIVSILMGIICISFLWAVRLKHVSFLQGFLDLLIASVFLYSIYYTGFSGNTTHTQGVIIYREGMMLLGASFILSAVVIFSRLGAMSLQKKN